MEFLISAEDAGQTLLEWLQSRLPDAPVSFLKHALRKERIRINASPASAESLLEPDDRIQWPDSQRFQQFWLSSQATTLLETDSSLVVYKPPGMPVHRTADCSDVDLHQILQERHRQAGAPYRIAPVHRLDRGTSGPVLFGKGKKALTFLGKTFMAQATIKLYLALVEGTPQKTGELQSPVVSQRGLQSALARYTNLGSDAGRSLLLLKLCTGRSHQLRQQLQHLGTPIVGDVRYGNQTSEAPRMALHCCYLAWEDPLEGEQSVLCPPASDFMALMTGPEGAQDLVKQLQRDKIVNFVQQMRSDDL